MTIDDFRYAELTQTEARGIDFSQVLTNSWDTARWNDDSSMCMVCWVGETPSTISSIQGFATKTQATMRTDLRTPGNKFRNGKGDTPSKKKGK
jgi:hypothetical protein